MSENVDSNPLVSIVVPCCGQLEHTRLSVSRLLRHSRPPFELLCVEVGSLDGTGDYLCGVADAAPVHVEIVRRGTDREFASAVTEAFARAGGQFVVWMNNDVLVPKLWLQQLVALANSNKTFGMVGPMSNMAPEPQRVPEVPYRLRRRRDPASAGPPQPGLDTTPFDQFAQEYRERNKGQWAEVERLGGFCLLLRRAALSTGALLEGQGEDGVFDADRLCLRVRRAGHRLACCRDLYVHHFGSHWAAAER